MKRLLLLFNIVIHNLPAFSIQRKRYVANKLNSGWHNLAIPVSIGFQIMGIGLVVGILALPSCLNAQGFNDVAVKKGVVHSFNDYKDDNGCGVSFFDFNDDGWADLSFPQTKDSLVFYRNDSGDFTKINLGLNNPKYPRSILWWDYDNDGDYDLFVAQRDRSNYLYKNIGNLNFIEVTQASGLKLTRYNSHGASVADINKDGLLDLYVSNYSDRNQLYLNKGSGKFKEIAKSANVRENYKHSFQGIWFDANNDDYPDLYVINDLGNSNSLFINKQNNTFREVSISSNTSYRNQHPMSASAVDFDHDEDLDIYMSNSFSNAPNTKTRDGMFLERGNSQSLYYHHKANDYGINIKKWSWGALWIDGNNNTYHDLVVTTALYRGSKYYPNVYYESQQADTFVKKPSAFKTSGDTSRSYSIAKADFNHDGFPDMVIQHQKPGNAFLWKNDASSNNNYIKLSLTGTESNRMAIGSKIHVYVDTNTFYKYTQCGQNYLSQNSQYYIFGLGQYQTVDSITVEYQSGHTDRYYNLKANKHYRFNEGETIHVPVGKTTRYLCKGDSVKLSVGKTFKKYRWNTGQNSQSIQVDTGGQYWVKVTNQYGVRETSDTLKVNKYPEIKASVKPTSCFNGKDGRIQLNLDSFSRNSKPQIVWPKSGKKGKSRDSLETGTYTYTYTDTQGCTFTDSIKVSQPAKLAFRTNVSQNINRSDSLGQITAFINGGTAPYDLYLDGNPVSNPIAPLARGTYQLKVVDAEGCSRQKQVKVSYSNLPQVSVQVDSTTCSSSSDGRIRLRIDTLPNTTFRISWSDGSKGLVRKGVGKGWYPYNYSDNQGGKFQDSVYVPGPAPLKLKVTSRPVTKNYQGMIAVDASGGTPPYRYYDAQGQLVGDSLKQLSAGTYTVQVQDRRGCTASRSIKIVNQAAPDIIHKVKPVSCSGNSDGVIAVEVKGRSTSKYGIKWDDGKTGTIRRNLTAGSYGYTYQDTQGFKIRDSVKVKSPEPLVATYEYREIPGGEGCRAKLKVEGGTKPYEVYLDSQRIRNAQQVLLAGEHEIKVKDDEGCKTDTVLQVPVRQLASYEVEKDRPSCHGDENGSIALDYPFKVKKRIAVEWSNGRKGTKRNGLSGGSYGFRVQSRTGCQITDTITLRQPAALQLKVAHQRMETKSPFWRISTTIEGGRPPYQIKLNGRPVESPIDSVKGGKHKIKVKDKGGCTQAQKVTLSAATTSLPGGNDRASTKLIPNPAKLGQTVKLQLSKKRHLRQVIISNSQGIVRQRLALNGNRRSIIVLETQALSTGFYVLRIKPEKGLPLVKSLIIN